MTPSETHQLLKERFGEAVVEFDETVKTPFIRVTRERLLEVMQTLRSDDALQFDYLQLVTGVDYPTCFTVVWHLHSISKLHSVTIKVELPREDPTVASVAAIWPAADWHERETFDLMGIIFEGHPDLRRILLPEDWEGHPLRKDYVPPEEYHGISNRRTIGDDEYPKADEDAKAIQQYKAPKQKAE
jgi:NADH-quinone oxidoreductase subunit C